MCRAYNVVFYVAFCVMLQAKAEDVDLPNAAPLSDNLIDFTDPTPTVSLNPPYVLQVLKSCNKLTFSH